MLHVDHGEFVDWNFLGKSGPSCILCPELFGEFSSMAVVLT